jgi:hypothetical protein
MKAEKLEINDTYCGITFEENGVIIPCELDYDGGVSEKWLVEQLMELMRWKLNK